jgi:hypothetical protein
MATRFNHSARIEAPVETVFNAYGEEAFWRDRLANVGTPADTLDDFVVGDDSVTVTVTQQIPDEDIPDLARKVIPGKLVIVRTTVFTDFDGESYKGTSKAEAAGGLGRIESATEASGDSGVAVEAVDGQIRVSVPLLGGKLEKLVVTQLNRFFDAEYKHLNRWTAGH